MPSFTEPLDQKVSWTCFACLKTLACSYTFTNMMYQLPIDMITRMMSVPRETKSPWDQSASSPYGLATTSWSGPAAPGGGGVGVAGLGASAAAGGVAGTAAGGVAWASAVFGAM